MRTLMTLFAFANVHNGFKRIQEQYVITNTLLLVMNKNITS